MTERALLIVDPRNPVPMQLSSSTVILPTFDDSVAKVPFRSGFFAAEIAGNSAGQQTWANVSDNDDGSFSGLFMSVPSGGTGSGGSYTAAGSRIRFPFYGRVLGIRSRRDSNQYPFSVVIDGVSYGLFDPKNAYFYNENQAGGGVPDSTGLLMIDNNLPDGEHICEIMLPAPAAGTASVQLFGYVAEKRAGYSDPPRQLGFTPTAAVPTTAADVINGTDGKYSIRGIRKIIYTNTTVAAITATVTNRAVAMWSKSVPANDSLELDFGGLVAVYYGSAVNGNIKHVASAAGLNATVIGGY